MFNNLIEFSYAHEYEPAENVLPIPAKQNIPDWFKKLEHKVQNVTVKGCMPFLDSLTAGYILRLPQDLHLDTNYDTLDNDGKPIKDSSYKWASDGLGYYMRAKGWNLNSEFPDKHSPEQLKGSPLVQKNNGAAFLKVCNPFRIKTPPGYSCLFVPPLNNRDDRFEVLSGIVDTDTFTQEVNFPFTINNDKYPRLNTIIERGTPYVQVIPFKRESWKMKIKERSKNNTSFLNYANSIMNNYKNKYWNKKSWK